MQHTDQMGRTVELPEFPRRIVSLVPSQTELLYYLGLNDEVVGITKFCVHPDSWFHQKTRVGGTKQLDLGKIRDMSPDLVIANKEENVQEQIEALAKDFPVWISDVNTLDDALDMITSLGIIIHKKEEANVLVKQIRDRFDHLHTVAFPKSTTYFIWRAPYMTVGGDTFIHDMLQRAGFENVFGHKTRYPVVDINELKHQHCELLLLSTEPYPFNENHMKDLQAIFPETKILIADGEMFSWYGSRLLQAPAYFEQLQLQVLSLKHAAGN